MSHGYKYCATPSCCNALDVDSKYNICESCFAKQQQTLVTIGADKFPLPVVEAALAKVKTTRVLDTRDFKPVPIRVLDGCGNRVEEVHMLRCIHAEDHLEKRVGGEHIGSAIYLPRITGYKWVVREIVAGGGSAELFIERR